MSLKLLIIFAFATCLAQSLSLRTAESFGNNSSQENSTLKLNESIQLLGNEGTDAIDKVVTRVERKLHNSRYRGASSSASPIRSLPLRGVTKYGNTADTSSETSSTDHGTDRQIQQWQVAVVVPPGLQQSGGFPPGMQVSQGAQPPPGSIWIQIPGYYNSNHTPVFYPGYQPTPVEQSPVMPSETTESNAVDRPSNEGESSPENEDQHHDNEPANTSDENAVPGDGTDDSDVVSAERDPNTNNEMENNQNSESESEHNVSTPDESNNQNPAEIEAENNENAQPVDENENHETVGESHEPDANHHEIPQAEVQPDVTNENQESESNMNASQEHHETSAEEDNYPSHEQDGNHYVPNEGSNHNDNQEEPMPPKMNMSPEDQDNAGQMNEIEPEMSAGEHNDEHMGNRADDNGNGETGDNMNTAAFTPPNHHKPNTEELLQSCESARGQFPSRSSCRKFVNCWDGTVVEQECPSGLLFSYEGFCDFSRNVNCGDRPNHDSAHVENCKENPYGSFRNPHNCSEFFICVYKDPVKFSCPYGLKYNDEIGVCDFPYRVHCYNYYAPTDAPMIEETSSDNGWRGEGDNGVDGGGSGQTSEEPQYTLRKVPAGLVDTGLRCKSGSVVPLGKGCGRVSICAPGGFSQLVTCPQRTAYDRKARRCIAVQKARC